MTKVDRKRIDELEDAVNLIDEFSQKGFSQIAAIATLALTALETPDGRRHLDDVAEALNAIRGKAQDTENLINVEAEQVSCNYKDESQRRRAAAQQIARENGHE